MTIGTTSCEDDLKRNRLLKCVAHKTKQEFQITFLNLIDFFRQNVEGNVWKTWCKKDFRFLYYLIGCRWRNCIVRENPRFFELSGILFHYFFEIVQFQEIGMLISKVAKGNESKFHVHFFLIRIRDLICYIKNCINQHVYSVHLSTLVCLELN